METCIVCRRSADERSRHGVIQTGRPAGSAVTGVDRGVIPNQYTVSVLKHYTDIRVHPVAFCDSCWDRNRRLFKAVKILFVYTIISELAGFGVLIARGNQIHFAAVGGLILLPVLVWLVALPVMIAVSPAQRALVKTKAERYGQEAGSKQIWIPFQAHWPGTPFLVNLTQQSARNNDTFDKEDPGGEKAISS